MTIEQFLNVIKQYGLEEYFAKFGEIEQVLKTIESKISSGTPQEKEKTLEYMAEQVRGAKGWVKIHILSFCMKVSGNAGFAEELLDTVLGADTGEVGEYNKLSHFWQMSTTFFVNRDLQSPRVEEKMAELYRQLFLAFAGALGLKDRNYIPWQEREHNLVFVFTSQVLGMEHAPTKTLLDRCYVLKKFLHKEVFIINTAMQVPSKGQAPFYGLVNAEYADVLSGLEELEFKGERFGFYQCENKMPDLELMAECIRMVKRRKPEFLLMIGGSDICADLCGLFVPQITVSTVFSKIATSCGEYQIVDKELNETDRKVLSILGAEPQKVKRARFTFSFKVQSHNFTRAELGLSEGKFVLVVVGWRLDAEVDSAFLEMLERVVRKNEQIEAAFMGEFDSFAERMKDYPLLEKNSRFLGKQMDALAVLECCSLYVNPKRNGGGSSVSEALYQGLPAVTLPMGDVSVAAGESFRVPDYGAMERQILRYAAEPEYYR
ncbi:MAG: glycosyltransferase, partial [Roseburia sp.]|nr:glycosyltransferase [Roseburia sp.]